MRRSKPPAPCAYASSTSAMPPRPRTRTTRYRLGSCTWASSLFDLMALEQLDQVRAIPLRLACGVRGVRLRVLDERAQVARFEVAQRLGPGFDVGIARPARGDLHLRRRRAAV